MKPTVKHYVCAVLLLMASGLLFGAAVGFLGGYAVAENPIRFAAGGGAFGLFFSAVVGLAGVGDMAKYLADGDGRRWK